MKFIRVHDHNTNKLSLKLSQLTILKNKYYYIQTYLNKRGEGFILLQTKKDAKFELVHYPSLKKLAVQDKNLTIITKPVKKQMNLCQTEEEMKQAEKVVAFSVSLKHLTLVSDFTNAARTGKKYKHIYVLTNEDKTKYYTLALDKNNDPVQLYHNLSSNYLTLKDIEDFPVNPYTYAFLRYHKLDSYAKYETQINNITKSLKTFFPTNSVAERNQCLKEISQNLNIRARAMEKYLPAHKNLVSATEKAIYQIENASSNTQSHPIPLERLQKQKDEYEKEINNQNNFIEFAYAISNYYQSITEKEDYQTKELQFTSK